MSKISCKAANSLKEPLFNLSLSKKVTEAVCHHLMECEECRTSYVQYIEKMDLQEIFESFYAILVNGPKMWETPQDYVQAFLEDKEFIDTNDLDIKCGKDNMSWTDYANIWDVYKLCQIKAFRDFTREYDKRSDDGTYDYDEFNKFMALKICQKVDHLEHCFSISMNNDEVSQDERIE